MNEDDNIIWSIIDKYFEDNTNILIRHHLASYNDFFNNKIFNIIKEKNPIKILKEQDPNTKQYNLQAEIYFGGKEGNKLYFGKPIIYDENRKTPYLLFFSLLIFTFINIYFGIETTLNVDIAMQISSDLINK